MLRIRHAAVVLFLALLAVPALQAATYIVPPDAEMIQQSDDIVVAVAGPSTVERDARGGIVTRYTLQIEDVIKGHRSAGATLVITERGGVLGGMATMIPGTPEYAPGVRYLIFTSANAELDPTTYGLALGQFHLVGAAAVRLHIHGFDAQNFEPHVESPRDAERFIEFIRNIVAQRPAPVDYFVTESGEQLLLERKIATNFTRNSYLMQLGGVGFRWSTPSASFVKSKLSLHPGPSNGSSSVAQAFGQWNSTGTSINYSDGGNDDTAVAGLNSTDGKNAILFGDPNNEISGAAGLGGITAAFGPQLLNGEQSFVVDEADVVIENQSFSQSCLNSIMTHEVGHTLGFRHSDEPPAGGESTSDAIMNSVVQCSWNGILKTYDQNAASTVYGSGGPTCNAPTITTPPPNRNISLGSSTSLSVVAGGTGPFTYQWFIGSTGDTSQPTGTSSASITVSPTSTTNYWVRVSNNCNGTQSVNSATATVTVTCNAPAISQQPSSTTITEGGSAFLQVGATGSGLSYQWFQGAVGNTSLPVGANAPSLSVSPTSTTQYWVRVSGACGSPVDSNAATVTVNPCAEVEVQAPTATPNPGVGNFRLNVNAFSTATPLQFAWFEGTTPGFGGIARGFTQAINVTVTQPTSYWARVTNGCGKSVFSTLITVAPCTLPSIATQPEDKSIVTGSTASLAIAVTGAGSTIRWYRGNVGDRANEVGTGTSVTVGPLFETTKFWAEVTNTCGAVSSRAVTVTVDQATTNLFMLNRRFNVQVRYRNQFANPPSEGLLTGQSLQASTLADTAVFWFDSPLIVELMVRVADARPFDNNFHIYLGGLSDVEFTITVTDTVTGKTVEYKKAAGSLVGQVDRKSFPTGSSLLEEGIDALIARTSTFAVAPNADTTTLRMLNRYDVRVRYRNQFASPIEEGFLLGRSITKVSTTETAVWYFNNPESVEWIVRFSDVRPFANRIDFFHGGMSDVEYTVEVTDTMTGAQRSYPVAPFSIKGGVDRDSFRP